jgi:hypothetical protein
MRSRQSARRGGDRDRHQSRASWGPRGPRPLRPTTRLARKARLVAEAPSTTAHFRDWCRPQRRRPLGTLGGQSDRTQTAARRSSGGSPGDATSGRIGPVDDRICVAVENNAKWCDLVCRSHGISTSWDDGFWVSRQSSPQFYPEGVTLQPKVSPEQLINELPPGLCSVKDSFADLAMSSP